MQAELPLLSGRTLDLMVSHVLCSHDGLQLHENKRTCYHDSGTCIRRNVCGQECIHRPTLHACIGLGCSGIGKTPLACALAVTLSQHRLLLKGSDHRPGFKTTSHLDFLRGLPGSKEYPVQLHCCAQSVPGCVRGGL